MTARRLRSIARATLLRALLPTLVVLAPSLTAAAGADPAASTPSAGPCRNVRLPARGPLAAERERIAKADAALQKRNDALKLRGGTLDVTDLAAVEAYDRDVAALEADAAANDHAWEAYEAKLASTNRAAGEAARCGRLATGAARPAAAAASAAR